MKVMQTEYAVALGKSILKRYEVINI